MLAIGIVVDDAIVVVEAVEHHIEHGLKPRAATLKAMSEVSSPVIAVGLVLSAVFIPCAFITGITGQFFRQFALTIASSTVISTVNSLTLSPALAAMLLEAAAQGGVRPRCRGRRSCSSGPGRATPGCRPTCWSTTVEGASHQAGAVASAVARGFELAKDAGFARERGGPAGIDPRGDRDRPGGHVAGQPRGACRLRVVQPGLHGHGQRLCPADRGFWRFGRAAGVRRVAGPDRYLYSGLPPSVRDSLHQAGRFAHDRGWTEATMSSRRKAG